jgi:hypothetical protein
LVWKGNNFTVVNLPSSEGSESQNIGLNFRETIKPVVLKKKLVVFQFFCFQAPEIFKIVF